MDIKGFVEPWSPWIGENAERLDAWLADLPPFRRPIYFDLVNDLTSIPQIISVTGPRRVGKSTLLKQIIRNLLEQNVPPELVIYYSFDDPALFLRDVSGGEMVEELMAYCLEAAKANGPAYLFLDEIQTLDRWEQYLKKYVDLNYPIRVVISGSASSPIFKRSRESLLGRVKDYHVLPFSFREYLLYLTYTTNRRDLLEEAETYVAVGESIKGMLAKSPEHADLDSVRISTPTDDLLDLANSALDTYLVEGGFPEVWELPTAEKKIEYLYDNQVKKVITEDLVVAVEFRKPEQLKTFYISLLEQPGREVNMTTLSQDIGISVQQIDKFLPLLEMTDLVRHASKFRRSAVRVRRGNQKFYPVDMALRNAVLRIGSELLQDEGIMGLYAENLVFNSLKKWQGVLQIDYYREGSRAGAKEVDFVVHTNPSTYWPVEVKYSNNWNESDIEGLSHFRNRYPCHFSAVVTKHMEDFGKRDTSAGEVFQIPLLLFLLLFD